MKQSKIIMAYKVLNRLAGEQFPLPVSYGLYKIRRELEPQWAFQAEQEKGIVENVGASVDENGVIRFPTDEAQNEYINKLRAIQNMDVEINFEPVTIDANTTNINLSIADLEALDGFIKVV